MLAIFAASALCAFAGTAKHENIPYGAETADAYKSERLKLDVYIPEGKKDFATLVWFHGGGLTGGNKFMNVRTTAIDIASRGVESPAINNSKILIENNEFYYSDSVFSLEPPHRERHGNAIFVDNAENITIRNNKFFGFPDKDRVIMTGRDTKDLHIEKNRFRGEKAAAEK